MNIEILSIALLVGMFVIATHPADQYGRTGLRLRLSASAR